jgi:hypothetical protein
MASNADCADCGGEDDWYMVVPSLWLAANPEGSGRLCIQCLEQRLGRTLTRSDFTDCFVNRHPSSALLCERLDGPGELQSASELSSFAFYASA